MSDAIESGLIRPLPPTDDDMRANGSFRYAHKVYIRALEAYATQQDKLVAELEKALKVISHRAEVSGLDMEIVRLATEAITRNSEGAK